jgi:hypothetical protein
MKLQNTFKTNGSGTKRLARSFERRRRSEERKRRSHNSIEGVVGLRVFGIRHLVDTPLPVFSALLIIVGVVLVAMGVIAEMLMRIYYETQNKTPYEIRELINF